MIPFIRTRWSTMSSTDKTIYKLLIVVMTALLLYSVVWLPAQKARARLTTEIATKLGQWERMQQDAADLNTLKSSVNTLHRDTQSLLLAIQNAAHQQNFSNNFKAMATPHHEVSVSVNNVAFAQWIRWVETLQMQHHIGVSECHIVATAKAGVVQVQATLVAL